MEKKVTIKGLFGSSRVASSAPLDRELVSMQPPKKRSIKDYGRFEEGPVSKADFFGAGKRTQSKSEMHVTWKEDNRSNSRAEPLRIKERSRKDAIWTTKHEPRTSGDLNVCIHSGTVDRVRDWLEIATQISYTEPNRTLHGKTGETSSLKRLVVLSGKPGTGKSTAVRVVAKELGLEVSEWNDTFGQVQSWRDHGEDMLLPDPSRDTLDTDRDFRVPYVYSSLAIRHPVGGRPASPIAH
jgi:hypothetical protein